MTAAEWVALVQGVYFLVTGIWPLVSLRTFLMVTGDKTDKWLVQIVGLLITAIAVCILLAAYRQELTPAVITLAIGSAAALGAADVIFVVRRVIPKIYLADAVAEAILIVAWVVALAP